MEFIGSSIGLDDSIAIDDINYFSIPGPSFTPGIGGTYKEPPPPHSAPEPQPPQWADPKPSPGCEDTLTAGWRTKSYCTPKTVTCDLERPYYPTRTIEPGRLTYLLQAVAAKKRSIQLKNQLTVDHTIYVLVAIALFYVLFISLHRQK